MNFSEIFSTSYLNVNSDSECCLLLCCVIPERCVCLVLLCRMTWWWWPLLPALLLLSELSVARVQTAPCQTCRKLTDSFIKVGHFSKYKNKSISSYFLFFLLLFFKSRAWKERPTRTLVAGTQRGRKRSWPSTPAGESWRVWNHSHTQVFI